MSISKYTIYNNLDLTSAIVAEDLLDFIDGKMDANSLLKTKITEENKMKIDDAKKDIQKANDLFVEESYSRMLLPES